MFCFAPRLPLAFLVPVFFNAACGSSSNLNKLIFSGEKDETELSTLMQRAELAYDKGNIDEAFDLASLAADKAPGSERAAVLLGFVSLSQAGSDPFKLVEKLMDLSDTTSTSNKSDGCKSLTSSSGSTSDASDVMGALVGCLANIPDSEMSEIGTEVSTEVSQFSDYPVLKPVAPSSIANPDSPRAKVTTLRYLNEAIAYLCPFVNTSTSSSPARNDDDPRHDCQATSLKRSNQVKSHFVWAMAHLVEALAFYRVLMYSTSDDTATGTSGTTVSSNLMKRVDIVKSIGTSDISNYVKAITELKSNFDDVFVAPAEGESVDVSMLQSTMLDLKVTSAAFGAIPGVPDEITSSITQAIDALTTAAGAAGDISSQSTQLQGQLNKVAASTLKSSIDKISANQVDASQQEEICDAYDTIAVGTTYQNQLPNLCK